MVYTQAINTGMYMAVYTVNGPYMGCKQTWPCTWDVYIGKHRSCV